MNRKKGFTLVELLVVIAIIALLIGLLLPALAKARANAQSLRDKTQITQIHKAALGFAEENKGWMPVPGLINRVGANLGQGDENFALNTTANLYSAMISQNLFNPDLLFGTTEVNSFIVPDQDYNYEAYKPMNDTYWDSTFQGDPSVAGCNVSYSHGALFGLRKKNDWKNTQRAGYGVFGTRGTGGGPGNNGGARTGPEYEKSPTLLLHGPKKQWMGHICFNDNHVETIQDFFTSLCTYQDQVVITRDNFFAAEYPAGQNAGDTYMGMFTSTVTATTGVAKFDQLLP